MTGPKAIIMALKWCKEKGEIHLSTKLTGFVSECDQKFHANKKGTVREEHSELRWKQFQASLIPILIPSQWDTLRLVSNSSKDEK